MKKIGFLLLLLIVISCNKDQLAPSHGSATFSMSVISRSAMGGRIMQTSGPASVLLSIEDNNGKIVLQNKILNLYTFGSRFESESIDLAEGSYKLVQFQVLNANDTVIYASPLAGSALAQYVSNPLPVSFTITKDAGTKVVPQVLEVSSSDVPENFGYASFGFQVISREIIFELFTSQDFSRETGSIVFEAMIFQTETKPQTIIWDSTFAPMLIKDIPSIVNKIAFKKSLAKLFPNGAVLGGFKYTIEGVGYSWYYEQVKAGEQYKTISFDFK